MPLVDHEINGDDLSAFFMVARFTNPVLYLERVSARPGQGVTSMFTFGKGYGYVQGIAKGWGIPVRLVSPVVWKRVVLSKDYAHDKDGAVAFCQHTYPDVSLIPEGCRVPHDGICDALCIATYGLREEMK
jgi:crossover junction endodeoxyribonuclease RuvC